VKGRPFGDRMPGLVMFGRRWSFGSDDLVVPTIVIALLHTAWYVALYAAVETRSSSVPHRSVRYVRCFLFFETLFYRTVAPWAAETVTRQLADRLAPTRGRATHG